MSNYEFRIVEETVKSNVSRKDDHTFTSLREVTYDDKGNVDWFAESPDFIELTGSREYLEDVLKKYSEAFNHPTLHITTTMEIK